MKLLASLLSGLTLAAAVVPAFAAARPDGEKIDFTAPREPATSKPSITEEAGERNRFGQRRESTSVVSELPAGALPSSEDVDRRTRLILGLLERRAEQNRMDLEGSSLSLDDPSMGDGSDAFLGLDSGSDRLRERGGRRERGPESSGRLERSRDDNRDRDWDRTSPRDRGDDRSSGNSGRDGQSNAETGKDRDGQSSRETSFLPPADSLLARGKETESRGSWDNFLETGRLLSRGNPSRASDEAARGRTERMDAFRKLLESSAAPNPLGVNLGGGPDAKAGLNSIPGAGAPTARSLSESFGGRSVPATEGLDRSFAMPTRPAELDLGLGRGVGRSVGDSVGAASAAPRPMELFQRKHDSRLPTRDF